MRNYQPKYKLRKFKGKCAKCGKKITEHEAYSYVDANNASITHNSPNLCIECYRSQYER